VWPQNVLLLVTRLTMLSVALTISLQRQMIRWLMNNWKENGRIQFWPNFKWVYRPSIRLKRLRKHMKNLSQDSRSAGRDLNPEPNTKQERKSLGRRSMNSVWWQYSDNCKSLALHPNDYDNYKYLQHLTLNFAKMKNNLLYYLKINLK
jgi:hypothetical protein